MNIDKIIEEQFSDHTCTPISQTPGVLFYRFARKDGGTPGSFVVGETDGRTIVFGDMCPFRGGAAITRRGRHYGLNWFTRQSPGDYLYSEFGIKRVFSEALAVEETRELLRGANDITDELWDAVATGELPWDPTFQESRFFEALNETSLDWHEIDPYEYDQAQARRLCIIRRLAELHLAPETPT